MFDMPHPIRDRLRKVHRRHMIADVMAKAGVNEAQATEAVDKAESERPILDWLASLDWEAILSFVLTFLPLILAKPPEPVQADKAVETATV